MISGFLITGLVVDEITTTGRFSIKDFYVRRARRILPAAITVLLATGVAARLVLDQTRAAQTLTDIGWALGFAANIHLSLEGTSYFQSYLPPSLVQHYWSLAVEEQFYVVWPLLLLAVTLIARRIRPKAPGRVLLPMVLTVVVLSFAWCVVETATRPDAAYFSTLGRAWELGLGAVVALLARRGVTVPQRASGPLALLGLALIVGSAFVLDTTSRFPGPGAAVPVVATALVLLSGVGVADVTTRWHLPLSNPLARYVGRVSFSLYLVHWPTILVVGVLVPATSWVERPLTLVAMAALTLLCHYLVERPFHLGGRTTARLSLRLRSAPAFVTTWLVVCTLLLWMVRPGNPAPPVLDTNASGYTLGPAGTKLQQELRTALRATRWPRLEPSFATVFARTGNGYGIEACDTTTAPLAPADDCTVGKSTAPKHAVVIGDSTSEAYIPTLREIVKVEPSWQVRYIGMAGCNFIDLDRGRADPGNPSANCVARTRVSAAYIRRTKPDLVIYTGSFFASDKPVPDSAGNPISSQQWLAGLERYVDTFHLGAGRLLFLAPPPIQTEIRTCFTPSSVPAGCLTRPQRPWKDFGAGVAGFAREKRWHFLDPRQWMCVAGVCPAFVGTTPARRDLIHLTPEYAELIAPAALEQLHAQGLFD